MRGILEIIFLKKKKKSFLFLWTRDEKEHTLIFQAVFGKTIKINSFAILLSLAIQSPLQFFYEIVVANVKNYTCRFVALLNYV